MPNAPGVALVMAAATIAECLPEPPPIPEPPAEAARPARPEVDMRAAMALLQTLEAPFDEHTPFTGEEYALADWLSRTAAHPGVRRLALAYLIEAWEEGLLRDAETERLRARLDEAIAGNDDAVRTTTLVFLRRLDLPIDRARAADALEMLLTNEDLLRDQIARAQPALTEEELDASVGSRTRSILDALARLRAAPPE